MSKNLITCYNESIHWDLDGLTLDEAIILLQKKKEHIAEAHPAAIKVIISYDREPYEDNYMLEIQAKREETDKEAKKRREKEAKAKAQREQWERRQYEQLAKKFKDK